MSPIRFVFTRSGQADRVAASPQLTGCNVTLALDMTKKESRNCAGNELLLRCTICLLVLAVVRVAHADESPPLQHSTQCIVVVSDSWSATHGSLAWFEREHNSWRKIGGPVPVLLGRNGMGWGRGETDVGGLPGPAKREGDDKAPAGVFKLGTAFGYAQKSDASKLPYVPLTKESVAVDDPKSRYYNQLIDIRKIPKPDWRSAENMVLSDDRYKWGIVVKHNVPPVPGAGSNIFLHCWKDSSTLTSGCTAMAEPDMLRLRHWLDPEHNPRLVQLPRSIYSEMRAKWDLPELPKN